MPSPQDDIVVAELRNPTAVQIEETDNLNVSHMGLLLLLEEGLLSEYVRLVNASAGEERRGRPFSSTIPAGRNGGSPSHLATGGTSYKIDEPLHLRGMEEVETIVDRHWAEDPPECAGSAAMGVSRPTKIARQMDVTSVRFRFGPHSSTQIYEIPTSTRSRDYLNDRLCGGGGEKTI